jgi:polar amino acid transport system substrate-binding protein
VTKVNSTGDPEGVAPDLAAEVAMRLGVSVKYVTFKSPGELADAIAKDVWDIGLIGAEPQRAETIAFTSAYAEIDATYLVPSDLRLKAIATSTPKAFGSR